MAKAKEPWIEASEVIPMFPTLVWKLQLKADLRAAMEARIRAALERSNGSGYGHAQLP